MTNNFTQQKIDGDKRKEELVKSAFSQYGGNSLKVDEFLERSISFDDISKLPLDWAAESPDGYERVIKHLAQCTRNYAPV